MIYTDSKASTPMADQVETLSNKDGEILFSKLIYGQTYYIKETLPAIGYKSNDTIYKVVANTTNEIKLPITNNKTYIKISKKDIASKVEVPGAEIVIKDANGTEVVKYTSSNEESAKYYLPAGEYILTESIAPANYKILASEIKFSISSTGEVNILNDASDYYEVVNGYTITLYDEVINPKTAPGIRTILIATIGLGATSIYIYNTYKIKKQLI